MSDQLERNTVKSLVSSAEKPEQLVDLEDNANFTHLDNLIDVTGNQVRMTRPAHRLVVVSAK